MVLALPDKTLEPFDLAFLCLAWPGRHYLTFCGGARRGSACHWSRNVLQQGCRFHEHMEPVEVGLWSAGRTALALVVYLYVFGLYGVYLWKVRPRSWTYCGLARALQVGFMTLNLAPLDIWSGAWVAGLSVWVVVPGCGLGGTVKSNVTIDNTEAQYSRSTTYR